MDSSSFLSDTKLKFFRVVIGQIVISDSVSSVHKCLVLLICNKKVINIRSHLHVPRLQWGGEVCSHIEPNQWNSGEGRWGMKSNIKKKDTESKHFVLVIEEI